jgi:hypothetical protein
MESKSDMLPPPAMVMQLVADKFVTRFCGRTGCRLSFLFARAAGAVRHRWLALGRADRHAWRRLHLVDPSCLAGEPALARSARQAPRG